MKRRTSITAFLLVAVLLIGSLAGCAKQNTTTVSEDGGKYLYKVSMVNAKEGMQEDELYRHVTEKFNIDFEVLGVSYDNWTEKNRIWLSSGDMPDAVKWEFIYSDYLDFVNQKVVRALPDGYETKYPNFAKQVAASGISEMLKEKADGKLYATIPSYGFGSQAYQAGFDMNVDMYCLVYRKDWAEKLGIETAPMMEYEDVIDMARKFKEADLGNVGANNTVGIATTHEEAPNLFVTAFNSYYNRFHKVDGEYVYGMTEASTLEGLKSYAAVYEEGLLHPNFFAHEDDNVTSLFLTQKSGVFFKNCSGNLAFTRLKNNFKAANPDINPEEALALCWFTSPDGKVRGREGKNYWECTYYSPKMSEEKFDTFLTALDYLASHEAAMLRAYGFEGVDYTIEGDKITRLIEAREDGSYDLKAKYPSISLFGTLIGASFSDPKFRPTDGLDLHTVKSLNELGLAKLAGEGDFAMQDYELNFYSSDSYAKFLAANDTNAITLEIIMSGDVEGSWKKQIDKLNADITAIEKELNENIGG